MASGRPYLCMHVHFTVQSNITCVCLHAALVPALVYDFSQGTLDPRGENVSGAARGACAPPAQCPLFGPVFCISCQTFAYQLCCGALHVQGADGTAVTSSSTTSFIDLTGDYDDPGMIKWVFNDAATATSFNPANCGSQDFLCCRACWCSLHACRNTGLKTVCRHEAPKPASAFD